MQHIVEAFMIEGTACNIRPYGSGHINSTYCVETTAGKRYILQKINTAVFRDADTLMDNIVRVTGYLRDMGLDERHVLTIIPARGGALYMRDGDGICWRVYAFVTGGKCLDAADETAFYQSGVAFGRFQRQLIDFPAGTLKEVLPRFHDTPHRYEALHAAIAADVCGRARSVAAEIDFALTREAEADYFTARLRDGRLPLRVTHNDTKLNNVILDEKDGSPLCVIDLDTVMPGAAAYDFGDSLRFGASTAAEDERDLSRVHLSPGMYEAYARGFLQECGAVMTRDEVLSLPRGAEMMTLECGVRFLTDYLQGDTYFAVHREGHNLDRCRTQFVLLREMEEKRAETAAIIARCMAEMQRVN